jgi:hypothetical protein
MVFLIHFCQICPFLVIEQSFFELCNTSVLLSSTVSFPSYSQSEVPSPYISIL